METLLLTFNTTLDSFNEAYFHIVKEHIVFFIIVVASIIGKIKESSKRSFFSVWIVYLFGTFFHEVSHFLISLFLNGKPSWFSIFPSRTKDSFGKVVGYTLGYVESRNIRWYNVFFISMAPLLLIPLSLYAYLHFFDFVNESIYSYIFYVFIIVSLLFSSIPSSVDFKLLFTDTLKYSNKNGEIFKSETSFILNLFPIIAAIAYFVIKG